MYTCKYAQTNEARHSGVTPTGINRCGTLLLCSYIQFVRVGGATYDDEVHVTLPNDKTALYTSHATSAAMYFKKVFTIPPFKTMVTTIYYFS